jgi:chaperonin GroES
MSTDKQHHLKNLIVIGDRVLIKPKKLAARSKGGLYLPPGYQEKEEIQTGYVVKCGPGFPVASSPDDSGEPWKENEEHTKYIALQVKEGDLAIFVQRGATEITFNDEKYLIIPQSSILLLERDEEIYG